MATLPYTRVVDVTLTRNDNFPTRRGFGIPLIISEVVSDVTAGAVDAATRTKVYATMDEVAADWGTTTGAFLNAQRIFSQSPRPIQIKIGYMDDSAPANIATDLQLIKDYDDGFYWMLPTHTGAWVDDAVAVKAFADWTETQRKQCFIMSYDANTENPADTTSVSAQFKGLYDRTSIFYHDSTVYDPHAGIAAYCSTRNFDDPGSAYTSKFKDVNGIPEVDKGSAIIQAITGFVPGLGLDATQGHRANVLIDIGGQKFNAEGTTLNAFIDEIHFQDWVVSRTEEELLGIFLNNARVPYSNKGMNILAQGVQNVLQRGVNAGLIERLEDSNGAVRNFTIEVPRVSTVSAAQRRERIAPAITATFRYAGAIHWCRVNYTMNF